jgi:hypothetical protein
LLAGFILAGFIPDEAARLAAQNAAEFIEGGEIYSGKVVAPEAHACIGRDSEGLC